MKILTIITMLLFSSLLQAEEVKVNPMTKVFGYSIPEEYNLSDVEITLRNHGARGQGAYEIVVAGNGSLRYKSKTTERKADIDSLVVYSMLGDIYKTDFFSWPSKFIDVSVVLEPNGKIMSNMSETLDGYEFGLFLKIKNYRRTVFVTNESPKAVWDLVNLLSSRVSSFVPEANQ